MDAKEIAGDPLSLIGCLAAQKNVLNAIDGRRDCKALGQWAGTATLNDKRVVNLAVVAFVDEERTAEQQEGEPG